MARDFIRAEVRATSLVTHAAQLLNAIVDTKHAIRGRYSSGAEVYLEAAAEEFSEIRKLLDDIETEMGLGAANAEAA